MRASLLLPIATRLWMTIRVRLPRGAQAASSTPRILAHQVDELQPREVYHAPLRDSVHTRLAVASGNRVLPDQHSRSCRQSLQKRLEEIRKRRPRWRNRRLHVRYQIELTPR